MDAYSEVTKNILNIGRRRERRVYYRPDGTPTLPLPANPEYIAHYLAKGWTLEPPIKEEVKEVREQESSVTRCPYCSFEPKNAHGLIVHLKKHTKEEKA